MHVVYETLRNLGVTDKKVITVFNKQDVFREKVAAGELETEVRKDLKADETVKMAAKSGEGSEKLLEVLEKILRESKVYFEHVFSYTETAKIQLVRKYGQLLLEEYQAEGTYVKAYVPKEIYLQLFKGEQAE